MVGLRRVLVYWFDMMVGCRFGFLGISLVGFIVSCFCLCYSFRFG